MTFNSPWARPKPKPKRKKAKKKARKLPVVKKKVRKKKKAKKAATCKPDKRQSELPALKAPKRGKRVGKVKPKAKKVTVPAKCKTRRAPKPGKKKSDWIYPKCDDKATTLAQRKQWIAGRIPTAYPNGPYRPGRQPPHGSRSLTKRGGGKKGNEVPASYGMPDVAWFIDPRIAGHQTGKIVVAFSGGKDSMACLLYVIEIVLGLGFNPGDVIECWHHSVDGRPPFFGGSETNEFDWPCTEDYCRKICACLGIPLYFSWRVGGLMGEVLKGGDDDPLLDIWPVDLAEMKARTRGRFLEKWGKDPVPGARFTAPMIIEMPDRTLIVAGGIGRKKYGRRSFPVPGGIESGRWCSSVAKIDVGRSQLANRKDLQGKRVLFVTGERSEESTARSNYPIREFDSTLGAAGNWTGRHGTSGRHVEKWRPIHSWCEIDVWALIYRWRIRPHPAYRLGWGRLSCMTCIFGSDTMWASIKKIDRGRFDRFAEVEVLLDQEKRIVLEEARQLRAGEKKEKALKAANARIAFIERDAPLTERTKPRWRKLRRHEKKLFKEGKKLPEKTRGSGKSMEIWEPATPFKEVLGRKNQNLIKIALSQRWNESPLMDPWKLPAGAFGESSGPT